jgi:hypothetical protein
MASLVQIRDDSFFLNEYPKVNEALKSFTSWIMAKQQVQETTVGHGHQTLAPTQILALTRILSKAINQHVYPIQGDLSGQCDSAATLARVWNEIQTRREKPTKWLGRTSLQMAWKDLDLKQAYVKSFQTEEEHEFVQYFLGEFERLLYVESSSDAKLVWNADGGVGELTRRAQERQERAKEATEHTWAKKKNSLERNEISDLPMYRERAFIEEIED